MLGRGSTPSFAAAGMEMCNRQSKERGSVLMPLMSGLPWWELQTCRQRTAQVPAQQGRHVGAVLLFSTYVTYFGLDNTQTQGGGFGPQQPFSPPAYHKDEAFSCPSSQVEKTVSAQKWQLKKQSEQQDQPHSPPCCSREAWSCSMPCCYHGLQHKEPGLRGKHTAREIIRLVHHAFSCHFYSLGILLLRKICMKIESLFPKN